MRGARRFVALVGIVALVLAMLFGCSLLFKGAAGQEDLYIRLNIGSPAAAKAISVGEYEVTQVNVGLFAMGETLPFYTVSWYSEDGSASYLIPVSAQGEYRIEVTHVGDDNGETVEAKESAAFNIQSMVITVINITPGAVGVIAVEPGQEEPEEPPPPFAWMYGYWAQGEYAVPYLEYLEIREDGTWWMWERYDGSAGTYESGTWYVEDGLLIIVMEGMEVPTEVVKMSNDELIFIMMGEENHFYRKGTEPFGWVFDLPPTILTVSGGEWTERYIADNEVQLFTFQAPESGLYELSWKQEGDPGLPEYDVSIKVSAYRGDQETVIFEMEEMSGYFSPVPILLDFDETIYIVADISSDEGGTYGMRVLQPVP